MRPLVAVLQQRGMARERAEREEAKAKIKALEEAKKKKLHELEGKSVFT